MKKIDIEMRRYNHIISEIDRIYHEIALKQGYSDSVMMILYTLTVNDGSCLLSELVKQTSLSKQTINSALRKLEREEKIYLQPASGKAKQIVLTEKGTREVRQTVGKVIAMENRIYGSWKPEEWEMYMKLTERYLEEFREAAKEI